MGGGGGEGEYLTTIHSKELICAGEKPNQDSLWASSSYKPVQFA